MTEIIFIVEEAPEGGYTAKALGHSIFTEAAESWIKIKKESVCGKLILQAVTTKLRLKDKCTINWWLCQHTLNNITESGIMVAFSNFSGFENCPQKKCL